MRLKKQHIFSFPRITTYVNEINKELYGPYSKSNSSLPGSDENGIHLHTNIFILVAYIFTTDPGKKYDFIYIYSERPNVDRIIYTEMDFGDILFSGKTRITG